jgi:putative transposase
MREPLRFAGRTRAATVSKQADGDQRLVRFSRRLSRKQKGSANRAKAKTKLAKLHQRIGNLHIDALHKLTTQLATEFDTIAIEDLNVSGMLKNHCLARSIADAGFAEFLRQLTYKATMTGSNNLVVDRFFPSSQTCHSCGTIHAMKLNNPENPLPLGRVRKAGGPTGCGFGSMIE